MVQIIEVTTKKQLRQFITFPNQLYQNHPHYCPPLNMDEAQNFNPKRNPAYEYCDVKMFLAYQNKRIVGRIATIVNIAHNDKTGLKQLRFTRYDTIDDQAVSNALFDQVFKVAKRAGMNQVIGPIGFCDLDRSGLLVEGFEENNLFITIYNHPYYLNHLTNLGFVKDVDWVEYQIRPDKEGMTRVNRVAEIAKKRYGYKLLSFKSKKELKPYIPKVFDIINIAYQDLYGVVPITPKQVDMYVGQFLAIINLECIYILVDNEENIIGFGLMAPSLFEATKKAKGKLFLFGWYHILKALNNPKVLDLYLIGIVPVHQGRGANAVILAEAYKFIEKNKIEVCETGPELETNTKVQDQWKDFNTRQHRRRRCFIKDLEA